MMHNIEQDNNILGHIWRWDYISCTRAICYLCHRIYHISVIFLLSRSPQRGATGRLNCLILFYVFSNFNQCYAFSLMNAVRNWASFLSTWIFFLKLLHFVISLGKYSMVYKMISQHVNFTYVPISCVIFVTWIMLYE